MEAIREKDLPEVSMLMMAGGNSLVSSCSCSSGVGRSIRGGSSSMIVVAPSTSSFPSGRAGAERDLWCAGVRMAGCKVNTPFNN